MITFRDGSKAHARKTLCHDRQANCRYLHYYTSEPECTHPDFGRELMRRMTGEGYALRCRACKKAEVKGK